MLRLSDTVAGAAGLYILKLPVKQTRLWIIQRTAKNTKDWR